MHVFTHNIYIYSTQLILGICFSASQKLIHLFIIHVQYSICGCREGGRGNGGGKIGSVNSVKCNLNYFHLKTFNKCIHAFQLGNIYFIYFV